jgi:hypothetical protein
MSIIRLNSRRFTPPAGEEFWSPALILPQLAGWWDSADLSSLSFGTGVSQWRDKSGNDRHFAQGTGANQPAPSSLSGLSGLYFGGADQYMEVPAFLPPAGDFDVFLLVSGDGVAQPQTVSTIFDHGHAQAPGSQNFVFQTERGTTAPHTLFYIAPHGVSTFEYSNTSGSVVGAAPKVLHWKRQAASYLEGNGVVEATRTLTAMKRDSRALGLGSAVHTPLGTNYRGLVAEILYSSANLDQPTIDKVHGYLAHKYGLTELFPASHPYRNFPPLIGD